MPTIEDDRAFLINALSDLPDFLLSEEIYWPLEEGKRFSGARISRLSLGNIRLVATDLMASSENSADADLVDGIERIFQKWRSNWSRKAALEFSNRLGLWKDQLEELLADPSAAIYRYEIRQRVILDLLREDMLVDPPRHELDLIAVLDESLRGASQAAGFIWEARLQRGFPQDRFWYLYRALRTLK